MNHCTEVRFASLLSGGLITAIVVNPPESKLAKRTSVHCLKQWSMVNPILIKQGAPLKLSKYIGFVT